MKKHAPWFLLGAGVVICALGSGMSDGIGGTVPREAGAYLIGGVLIVLALGWFAYDAFHAKRKRDDA